MGWLWMSVSTLLTPNGLSAYGTSMQQEYPKESLSTISSSLELLTYLCSLWYSDLAVLRSICLPCTLRWERGIYDRRVWDMAYSKTSLRKGILLLVFAEIAISTPELWSTALPPLSKLYFSRHRFVVKTSSWLITQQSHICLELQGPNTFT